MQNQPAIIVALTGALTATVNLIALVFGWGEILVAAVNACIGAWVVVAGMIVKARTLTGPQLDALANP